MKKALPRMPGILAMMGPAFVWAAIAQGSGELIWWPYFAAKYGAALIGLLLPAAFIQFFINREISRYTAITGKGVWQGFLSLGKLFSIPLFVLCFVNFLWLGGYASAGGTALFELIRFPLNVDERFGSLFWAYVLMIGFSLIFIFSKVIYQSIENFMKIVSLITIVGLILASLNPVVLKEIPTYLKVLFNPLSIHWPASWEAGDASHLVTAIAFAGMGGFLNLLYSYWIKDKGVGMAKYSSKIKGLLVKDNIENDKYYKFSASVTNQKNWRRWLRFINFDAFLAVLINAFTAAMTTLLAFAILHPRGIYPAGWKIAVVQAEFFRTSFGTIGVIIFLIISSAFMIDTWIGLVDGVARQFADVAHQSKISGARSSRFWYYLWLLFLILTSFITVFLAQPGILITIVGVISIFAFILYIPALWYLNYIKLPRTYPQFIKPQKWENITLFLTWLFYLVIAVGYLLIILKLL
jgi:Mn2+/Fe2+ NRAMP family transporter